MSRILRVAPAALSLLVIGLAAGVAAQGAVQFRSDVRIRDLDGNSGTAKLYVGASKLRMEFQAGGETRPTIVDPRAETQLTISPGQRKYMEMPLGESGGTVRIPRIDTLNPADPCGNDRLTDCKRLGVETVNGYATEKWEYTNVDGDRETAWIATRLRFPVRTRVSNGATTEVTNVVEGAQPASLFELPAGYAKVDDIDGGSGAPGVDAATLQKAMEMANAMKGAGPGAGSPGPGGAPVARASGPSPYEGGPGWIVNVTVSAQGAVDQERKNPVPGRSRLASSGRYVASFPLNSGAPAIPGQGPQWSLLPLPGQGSPQADAAALSLGIESRVDALDETRGGCGGAAWGTYDVATTVTQKGALSTSIGRPNNQIVGTAVWQLNAAETSYFLIVQLGVAGGQFDEAKTTKHVDRCDRDKVTNKTETKKQAIPGVAFEARDVPMAGSPAAGIRGSKTIPWNLLQGASTATVEWTITQIGGR